VLDVCTTSTDNLCSQVEPREWFQVDRDLLLGPFPLYSTVSTYSLYRTRGSTHATEFVSLDLFLVPSPEATLVDQLGKLLINEFLDLGDGLFQTFFGRARYVEI
jgi:hypothetical protein